MFCTDVLSLFWRSPLPVPRDVSQHLVHQQQSSQRGKMNFGQGAAKQTEVLALFCGGHAQALQLLPCCKMLVVGLWLAVGQLSGEARRW